MTAVDKCSLPNRDNLMQPIHMQLFQKLKTFSEFFPAFSKSKVNFEHFRKKDDAHMLIDFIVYGLRKMWLDICSKSPASEYHSRRKYAKRVSSLFKFERQNLRHLYCSTGRQFSCKKSLLVICKSLRLFVHTVSAVDKCSLPNRDNLMQPIHMQLSQKLKSFSEFFPAFPKSKVNFEHFRKKDDAHRLFIS